MNKGLVSVLCLAFLFSLAFVSSESVSSSANSNFYISEDTGEDNFSEVVDDNSSLDKNTLYAVVGIGLLAVFIIIILVALRKGRMEKKKSKGLRKKSKRKKSRK